MGLCYWMDNYYNYVCIHKSTESTDWNIAQYYLFWVSPIILLAAFTLFMVIKITLKKRQKGFYDKLPKDFKLVLKVYSIPWFGFVFYLVDLIFSTRTPSKDGSVWTTVLGSIVFSMPFATLGVILVFKHHFDILEREPPDITDPLGVIQRESIKRTEQINRAPSLKAIDSE